MIPGHYYLLDSGEGGGRYCRKFIRYADNGDDLVVSDSNGTESEWDMACAVREISAEEVAAWPDANKEKRTLAEYEKSLALSEEAERLANAEIVRLRAIISRAENRIRYALGRMANKRWSEAKICLISAVDALNLSSKGV